MSEDDDAPVTRRELERGLRFVNLAVTTGREDLLRLAAQLVTLTDEVARRLGGPSLDDAVEAATPARAADILAADERDHDRVLLGAFGDKYEVENAAVPCAELIPICQARCCKLTHALSTQDLDEGVVRWDYGRPYLIRQRPSDGYCVHNDATSRGCTVHAHRPSVCRSYSCATDKRIWADFEQRILAAPVESLPLPGAPPDESFDLHARARRRGVAFAMEQTSLRRSRTD